MSNTQTRRFEMSQIFEAAQVIDSRTGKTIWFVSMDGEQWLPVADDPRESGTPYQVWEIFQPRGGFLPMRCGRNFLSMIGKVEFFVV